MHQITLTHESRLPLAALYEALADHNRLSKVFGIPVRRIRDGERDLNGTGSVRLIGAGPLAIEETVTDCARDSSIDYRITRGGFPLRDHRGRLEFEAGSGGGSRVTWTIAFDSSLPLAGNLVKLLLQTAIGRGLKRLG